MGKGFFLKKFSIADISIAAFFRNSGFVKYQIDATRWPKMAAFVPKILSLDCFEKLKIFEEKSFKTPILKQREALGELGAPLTAQTYFNPTPRFGVMMI